MEIKLTCGDYITENEKNILKIISEEYKSKIERLVKEIIDFEVRLKCYSKKGKIKRYEVEAKLIIPKHKLKANSEEYDLKEAIKNTMNKILNEIEHKTFASDKKGTGKRKK
ncbi:MAG: HPF/RaiA family ribosome-associated protein [Candidatus Pacearchaeota archaeon]